MAGATALVLMRYVTKFNAGGPLSDCQMEVVAVLIRTLLNMILFESMISQMLSNQAATPNPTITSHPTDDNLKHILSTCLTSSSWKLEDL